MKFKQLAIGDTFDFISPNRMMNSFYERCTKITARKYAWTTNDGRILESQVGTVNVEVYNVVPVSKAS